MSTHRCTCSPREVFDKYCTDGVALHGKHIGVVGHLNMPRSVYEQAASVRILERSPRPGDYPDSACDWLIPQCDVVIMTASTLVNKTLPHLLDLARNAYTTAGEYQADEQAGVARLSWRVSSR